MANDPALPNAAEPVELDLIPPELIKPRLRKFAWFTVAAAVLVALALGQFVRWPFAVLIPLVVLGPPLYSLFAGMRRRTTISGSVLTARAGGTRTVDLDVADEVTVSVRRARVTQVSLHVDRVHIALAVYMGEGGREVSIQALKALADGLAHRSPEVRELLMAQLRAEAIGAGLEQRPLYRAGQLAAGQRRPVTLTDEQVTALGE